MKHIIEIMEPWTKHIPADRLVIKDMAGNVIQVLAETPAKTIRYDVGKQFTFNNKKDRDAFLKTFPVLYRLVTS